MVTAGFGSLNNEKGEFGMDNYQKENEKLVCKNCKKEFKVDDGVPVML